jgi:predicted  nucleic acid-binding Zn-ribbon protein
MERLEEAQGVLDSLTAQLATTDARLSALAQSRDEAWAAIDAQLASLSADRVPVADGLPADLLALYDKLRAAKAGIGAAALRARACGGCQLTLDNAELAVIKAAPSDEVIRCEECQRILVRTAESGL